MKQRGQAMIEFVLVLPILLLLTVGTIELGIFLSRQITLTGAGFLAARAAAVGGQHGNAPNASPAKEVLRAYAQDAEQAWIEEVAEGSKGKVEVQQDNQQHAMRVKVARTRERWSEAVVGAASMMGAVLNPEIGQLGGTILINREWVKGRGGKSANQQESNENVEYSADLGPLNGYDKKIEQYKGPIKMALQPLGQISPAIPGLVDALTLTPLQAVAQNPKSASYHVGRTQAAVYASSDNEKIQQDPFCQPARLKSSTETTMKAIDGMRHEIVAAPGFTPAVFMSVQAVFAAVNLLADGADKGLRVLETTVFGAGK